jgi:hypothetical protein
VRTSIALKFTEPNGSASSALSTEPLLALE